MTLDSKKQRKQSKLRLMRMRRGMLQIELAEITGIPQRSLSLMEKNGIKRADKALVLARALDCTVEELIRFEPPRVYARANNNKRQEESR